MLKDKSWITVTPLHYYGNMNEDFAPLGADKQSVSVYYCVGTEHVYQDEDKLYDEFIENELTMCVRLII